MNYWYAAIVAALLCLEGGFFLGEHYGSRGCADAAGWNRGSYGEAWAKCKAQGGSLVRGWPEPELSCVREEKLKR